LRESGRKKRQRKRENASGKGNGKDREGKQKTHHVLSVASSSAIHGFSIMQW
jgi:hypothetical protein